eukprot:SAG22_NODE_262_length_13373_cov_11.716965_10_plen_822_part_00
MLLPLLGLLGLFAAAGAQLPPSPPTGPPVPPSPRDADWQRPFERADLLYSPGPRPDFEKLLPIENCTNIPAEENCTALWWPGLGNGFLGGIAQGPTLRIAGFHSGAYGRYTAGGAVPPVPFHGFSNKEFAYRASIPAFASSIIAESPSLLAGSARSALNTRGAEYTERSSLAGGGKLELRTYFHRTRRNLIVVDVELDCTGCTKDAQVSLRAFSRPELSDVVFQQRGSAANTAAGSPRQLIGVLRAPENCEPSNSHLYDTNHTLGYVHDVCPDSLAAAPGAIATVQLLSVLTVSTEEDGSGATDGARDAVVPRAMKIYEAAKTAGRKQLLDEHRRGWEALWDAGGIELATDDLALQQTTNATLFYLLMSTRPDWLYSTLVPSTIAASAPKPHGYFGTAFWDQDTFQAPPLMVFFPSIAQNLLQNRLFQLPAYKVNAKAFGLKGAYVPWEVGYSGGFARDNEINHREVHVAGDVALFVKQYCQMTQNTSELKELFPLLEAVSDFVVSRVNRTDENGWLSVENIVAPDESTGLNDVNNDIFTNAVGVLALETTIGAVATLGDTVVAVSQAQLSSWRHAAAKLKLQLEVFEGRLLHKEYDQYTFSAGTNDTKTTDPSTGRKVKTHPSIGQADSCLLGFPLQFNDSHRIWGGRKKEVRLNDISYYGPRVSPTGSYMTAGHYVIAWLERPHRDLANASEWFRKGRAKNYQPWRIWSEHDENDGGAVNFITAGGMFLQSLVFGYGGLRFNDQGISMDPVLPPAVRAMKLRGLNYADAEFDVVVDQTHGVQFSRRARSGDSGTVAPRRGASGEYWLTRESCPGEGFFG